MNFAKTNLAAPFVTITFLLYAATFAPRATAQNTIDEVDHAILQVAWSPSGNMLAVGKAAGFCDTTINLVTGETDPELLADALAQNAVYIVDAQTGVIEQTLIGNTCSANRLDWSPDGTKIASASGDSRGFRVWDAATGVLLAEDQRGGQGMSSLSWRPGSTNEMAVADIAGFTRIVSALTGEALIPLLDVSGTVVRWSSDGNHLMMGDTYRDRIRILDYPSLTTALLINVDDLWFADLSPTGNDLASITNSGLELEVWNAHTGALRLSITPDAGDYFYKLQYSPDSQYLAVTTNGNLIIYNSTTGVELSRFTHPGPLLTLDWSPDGSLLAYGGVRSDGGPAQLLIAGIVPPTTDLTGTITLPSRTPGTPAYAVPLSVKLADSGGALVSEHSPITDVNGYFTLQDLPQGTYGVWLKHAQSLAVMPSVTLDAPSVSLDFGT
ncbi:MAG: WD40 repeat domain-containing protein, partial [Anaerolineae bacterium]|nr:WD40 repeat domain-containing protein [Anaerolineae bacterium]